MPSLPSRFQPSGLNSHFTGPYVSFAEYIAEQRNLIANTRLDLANSAQRDWIIDSNAPFEMRPSDFNQKRPRKGMLLIHGLTGSPFVMRDFAQHFYAQGYLTRGILLPGHGTRPGDLLEVTAEDWLAATRFGIESFKDEVDELYLCGLSLGSVLCLALALQDYSCDGLILFAPALKIKSRLAPLTRYHSYFTWLSARTKWLITTSDPVLTRYTSLSFNAVAQTQKIIDYTKQLLHKIPLQTPLFMVLSADDEAIDNTTAIKYFTAQTNPNNKLLFYAKSLQNFSDQRIKYRSSVFPDQNVIDFSHHCFTVAPDNPYHGAQGSYVDLVHYELYPKLLQPPASGVPTIKGATSPANLMKYHLQRLSYNPDFSNMVNIIDEFLNSRAY